MALKQMEITEQIKKSTARIDEINSELSKLEKRANEMVSEVNEAHSKNEADRLSNLLTEDAEIETKRGKLIEEKRSNEKLVEILKNNLQKTIEGEPTEMELKSQATEYTHRDMFNKYLKTRDLAELKENGFISDDGDAVIPSEVITNALKEEVFTTNKLMDLINVEDVTTPKGSYPVLNKTRAIMHKVEELAANPNLQKLEFNNIDYEVDTWRAQLPISKEALDDAAVALAPLVAKYITTVMINTTNKEISDVMKTFTEAPITSVDDMKKIKNVSIDAGYNIGWVFSQSLFNALDTLKDENGRYFIQPDITQPSKKLFLGDPVTIVRDDEIGEQAGDMVGFVGDLRAGITYFDRKQYTAEWVKDRIYGEILMGAFRGDVEQADANAGYYLKYTAPTKQQLANPTPGMIVISKE